MASESFVLWNSQVVTRPVDLTNGRHDLLVSNVVNNSSGLESLRVIVEYESISPDGADGQGRPTYELQAVVESQQNGKWFPISYQFVPIKDTVHGSKREILMQPNLINLDTGIDDIIYVAQNIESRVSRQQGLLGPSFRVRIVLFEGNVDDPRSFQGCTISAFGERF